MYGRLATLLGILLLGACASVRGIDDAPGSFSSQEKAKVEVGIDRALSDEEWGAAWDQAVSVGASRARFEAIALQALADDAGVAEAMFEALREKWGALTPDGRTRARALGAAAIREGDWERAAQIEILVADDAPAYAGAWAIYEQAPADEASDILRMIGKARESAGETSD